MSRRWLKRGGDYSPCLFFLSTINALYNLPGYLFRQPWCPAQTQSNLTQLPEARGTMFPVVLMLLQHFVIEHPSSMKPSGKHLMLSSSHQFVCLYSSQHCCQLELTTIYKYGAYTQMCEIKFWLKTDYFKSQLQCLPTLRLMFSMKDLLT